MRYIVDVLAPFVRKIIAPAWARWERSPYLRHYRTLLRTQYFPPEVIRNRQWKAVTEIVRHAYETTPFYRDRLDEANIRPNTLRSSVDFSQIPLLTKDDLRSSGTEMLSSEFQPEELTRKTTSGSTGISVEVHVDEAAQQWKRGCVLRSDQWSGWKLGERIAAVWGNPDYLKHGWRGRLRNALLERRRFLDTLKMDKESMAQFATALERHAPSMLYGHAHSLYLFAEFVKSHGKTSIRPRGIISTAMVLHERERQTIEEVFQCPVTNRYGCEEVSLIACECEQHNGLHVNADGIYVEILRPDGTLADAGEPGRVVVTDLVNRAMPIIRYQVGDMAAMTDRRCPCGRGLPLIEKLHGRVADYVVTPRGDFISGISLTENFAGMIPGLAQLQIVQEEVDRFLFRIVKGAEFGPVSIDRIRELVDERFGAEVAFECEFVDRIMPEPSGKYRFCISKVQKTFAKSEGGNVPCIQA